MKYFIFSIVMESIMLKCICIFIGLLLVHMGNGYIWNDSEIILADDCFVHTAKSSNITQSGEHYIWLRSIYDFDAYILDAYGNIVCKCETEISIISGLIECRHYFISEYFESGYRPPSRSRRPLDNETLPSINLEFATSKFSEHATLSMVICNSNPHPIKVIGKWDAIRIPSAPSAPSIPTGVTYDWFHYLWWCVRIFALLPVWFIVGVYMRSVILTIIYG